MNQEKPSYINQGIQANNVTANVLAVGTGASAVQNSYDRDSEAAGAVLQELARFRAALASHVPDPGQRSIIEEDVTALQKHVQSEGARGDTVTAFLESLAKKLRLVGAVAAEATALTAPLRAIAAVFHLPLKLLGLP